MEQPVFFLAEVWSFYPATRISEKWKQTKNGKPKSKNTTEIAPRPGTAKWWETLRNIEHGEEHKIHQTSPDQIRAKLPTNVFDMPGRAWDA